LLFTKLTDPFEHVERERGPVAIIIFWNQATVQQFSNHNNGPDDKIQDHYLS